MDRDRLSLTTPEGVTLELTLAGVGSRGIAVILDGIIQSIAYFIVIFVYTRATSPSTFTWIVMLFITFVVIPLGYPILFEAYNGGQTPGKRAMNIRVMRADGGPLRPGQAVLRNLLRIVDILPSVYIVGIVVIFSTTRNQRLGDLAAGSIVVQELVGQRSRSVTRTTFDSDEPGPLADYLANRPFPMQRTVQPDEDVSLWETSRVTADELAVVRRFLDRRRDMRLEDRNRVGHQLAVRLNAKVTRPPTEMRAEEFLLALIRAKDSAP